MPIFLFKFWSWLKKYWQLILLIVGAIIAAIFFAGREVSFADDYKRIKEVHDEELKQIEEARAEERRKNAENAARLQKALAAVQKEYDSQREQLDNKKKKEIKKIVDEYGDDPVALAQRLSEATGFTVILPQD